MQDAFTDHPATERLSAFTLGLIGDVELTAIETHLNGCATCSQLLDSASGPDLLLTSLQEAVQPDEGAPEDAGERWRAVRALVPALRQPIAANGETHSGREGAPEFIQGYHILGEVGRGGMGVVYRADDTALKRPVALKMVLAGSFASAGDLARFRLEAEMAARVRHPNVVQVYESGAYGGRPFLVMEWVEGGSLANRIHPERRRN
jgi:Protein kinase domain